MSWVIYDFSHMFICLLWFCHGLPKGEIVRTYVFCLLRTYVIHLCNWLILWQNALYLYFRSCDHFLTYIVLIFFIYVDVCFSFIYPLHGLFIFSLYAHASYIVYAILYFCFTLRYLDEFCLKYFRNTGCQSLLAINSFLAKFFKSLC